MLVLALQEEHSEADQGEAGPRCPLLPLLGAGAPAAEMPCTGLPAWSRTLSTWWSSGLAQGMEMRRREEEDGRAALGAEEVA